MKLIVAEIIMECPRSEYGPGDSLPRPEGSTWYPDARVFVRTEPNTPRWIRRKGAVHDVSRAGPEPARP